MCETRRMPTAGALDARDTVTGSGHRVPGIPDERFDVAHVAGSTERRTGGVRRVMVRLLAAAAVVIGCAHLGAGPAAATTEIELTVDPPIVVALPPPADPGLDQPLDGIPPQPVDDTTEPDPVEDPSASPSPSPSPTDPGAEPEPSPGEVETDPGPTEVPTEPSPSAEPTDSVEPAPSDDASGTVIEEPVSAPDASETDAAEPMAPVPERAARTDPGRPDDRRAGRRRG